MKQIAPYTQNRALAQGFSYSREDFYAYPTWYRSLIAGAIAAGLFALCAFVYLQLHGADLSRSFPGSEAELKVAALGVMFAALTYAMINLFGSVCDDADGRTRSARVNFWLDNGVLEHGDSTGALLQMSDVQLSFVGILDYPGGVEVTAVGMTDDRGPFLIRADLADVQLSHLGHYFDDPSLIRKQLSGAASIWADTVSMALYSPQAALEDEADIEFDFDVDQLREDAELASSPSARAGHVRSRENPFQRMQSSSADASFN